MANLTAETNTAAAANPEKNTVLTFIGTYTGTKSKGIYSARFNPGDGSFSSPTLAAQVVNPTFLAVHPNKRWLYAVNETDNYNGKRGGALSALAIEPESGTLRLLNQRDSGGSGPCHVSVDHSGRCVLVANYGSGSVTAYRIEPDGLLSEPVSIIQHTGSSINPQRQSGPHAHQIMPDPANKFVLTCDLGLDQVRVMKFNPQKALLLSHEPGAASVTPGAGPRHLVFHPKGKFVYLLNELKSTLTAFAYRPDSGTLSELCTLSTLPDGFKGNNSGAEIQVDSSGSFLYTSNRGENSIAIFAIEPRTGIPRYLGHELTRGKTPRHFTLSPTGDWLVAENQDSNNVVVFRINKKTGMLSPVGEPLEVGAPVCLVFVQ